MVFFGLSDIFAAMDTVIFIPIAVLLIGGAFVIGMVRRRNFDRKENLHKQLARRLGISLSYLNHKDFTLFGNYRGYNLRLEVVDLSDRDKKEKRLYLKCAIPMINPQLKVLRIEKADPAFQEMDKLAILDRPVHMPHDIGDWLAISTNDMMFGSILLSDDLKISLFEVLKPAEAALLYIEGEELAFVSPQLILDENQIEYYQKATDLLADIKDELNR